VKVFHTMVGANGSPDDSSCTGPEPDQCQFLELELQCSPIHPIDRYFFFIAAVIFAHSLPVPAHLSWV
jgi:hypothetical protein